MTNTRRTLTMCLGLTLAGAAAAGCEGAQDTTDGTSTQSAPLFKDPATSGPRLDVYEIDGHTAIAVGGPIGTEGQVAGLTGSESLNQLYRALHPDTKVVPAELTALETRYATEMASLRAMPRPAEGALASVDKSQSAFNTNVCRSFREGSYKYTPVECQWSTGVNDWISYHNPNDILAGDRTYGWNNNGRQAIMNWYKAAKIAYSITLPNYWWTWMSIGSGGPYYAQIYLPNGATGELGLTHHSLGYTF